MSRSVPKPAYRGRLEAVFIDVAELRGVERATKLNQLCEGDAALREEVLSLLAIHDAEAGILDASPAVGVPASDLEKVAGAALMTPVPVEEGLPPGARFGSYLIEREIGVGGMGFVYVARQERPRRTVALKIIRRSLATPALLRRFELEADILARLQHPGIAQIYEAGSAEDGRGPRPFIAMELVENGKPLTEFCESRKLSVSERLELLVRVCDALHHAHQRGVIHRDLKPGNILIDEHAQPKILDFGVARAQGPEYTGSPMTTLHTNVGQIIGTLPYMSPEQVGGDHAEVDVRSDVYSLGVIVYQVLTGRLPLEVSRKPFAEAARVIRDAEPARLSSINRTLRGDLDTIVAMSLAKERSRRYQSAYDFGEDLRRYLHGEPILARRDSALYVLRKQMRRYKSFVAAAVVGLASLIGFVIYAGYQMSIKSALAIRETEARLQATQVAEELRETLYSANIGFAHAAYYGNDVERMRRVLDECPEELRGWEWRFLKRISDTSSLKFQAFEPAWGGAMNAPLSGTVLTYVSSTDVKVWSPSAQRGATAPLSLKMNTPISHGTLSPDGTKALLVAHSLACEMRDVATGAKLWESKLAAPTRWCGTFTRDGSQVVLSTSDRKIRFYNAGTGEVERTIDDPSDGATWIDFSPDGTLIGICDLSRSAYLLDSTTGALRAKWTPHSSPTTCLAFSNDSKRVATSSTDQTVRLFDVATQTPQQTMRSHTNKVYHIAYSPVKNLIASAGTEGVVHIHDGETGELVQRLYGHSERIISLRFFADGRLMTCSREGSVRIWDNVGEPDVKRISTGGPCHAAAASTDGRIGVARDGDGAIRVIDLPSGVIRATAKVKGTFRGADVTLSPDGTLLGCSDVNDGVVFSMPEAKERIRLTGHKQEVTRVSISPDDSLAATLSLDATVRVFDLTTGKSVHTLAPPSGKVQVALFFSSDGKRLATGGEDKLVHIWNVTSGTLERTLTGHRDRVFHLLWGKHDHSVISGDNGGEIIIWDLSSERPPTRLMGHNGPVYSLGISGDGSRLVSGGFDNTARLWNLDTRKELLTLRGHMSGVVCTVLTNDGNRLITAANDSRFMLWDAPPSPYVSPATTSPLPAK